MRCGDTIDMPRANRETRHLWIVATEPNAAGLAVIVNITTHREHSDRTVILRRGDHPFITHDSCVYYADATIANVQNIERAIENGIAIRCDSCSDELVARVQAGLTESDHTPYKVLRFVEGLQGEEDPRT